MAAASLRHPKACRVTEQAGQHVQRSESESIVLDFFAGQASTAHAVLALNALDGGNRRFIMVQLDEDAMDVEAAKAGYPTIADVGRERIRRAVGASRARLAGIRVRARRRIPRRYRWTRRTWRCPADADGSRSGSSSSSNGQREAGSHRRGPAVPGAARLGPRTDDADRGREDRRITRCSSSRTARSSHASTTRSGPELVREIAKREPLRAVFRDSGFASDADRINAEQIFAEVSPSTDVKVI